MSDFFYLWAQSPISLTDSLAVGYRDARLLFEGCDAVVTGVHGACESVRVYLKVWISSR